jgi:hypothetical protein
MLPEALLDDFHKGYEENYSAEDFERAAQRVLGDQYTELKALNATPAQICNEFAQHFFSGMITETSNNSDDISLLLAVSMEIYVGHGFPCASELDGITKEAPPLAELLVNDISAIL